MKKVFLFLHYFIKLNTWLLCYSIAYFAIKYTIGIIFVILFNKIVCECVSIILAITIVAKSCKISSPYEKYIS